MAKHPIMGFNLIYQRIKRADAAAKDPKQRGQASTKHLVARLIVVQNMITNEPLR